MRERLTVLLDSLLQEMDETSASIFPYNPEVERLLARAQTLVEEAKPMLGHSCHPKPMTTEEGACL